MYPLPALLELRLQSSLVLELALDPRPEITPPGSQALLGLQVADHGTSWSPKFVSQSPHSSLIWKVPDQFNSVTQLHPTLCNPMDCSIPGLPVHHQIPEFTHWVSDAIQPSHPHPFYSCLQPFPASGSFQMS